MACAILVHAVSDRRQEGPGAEPARSRQTLKNLPSRTRSALGQEAAAVRRGDAKTRKELNDEARRLDIRGRSKMGKDELRRAIARVR